MLQWRRISMCSASTMLPSQAPRAFVTLAAARDMVLSAANGVEGAPSFDGEWQQARDRNRSLAHARVLGGEGRKMIWSRGRMACSASLSAHLNPELDSGESNLVCAIPINTMPHGGVKAPRDANRRPVSTEDP